MLMMTTVYTPAAVLVLLRVAQGLGGGGWRTDAVCLRRGPQVEPAVGVWGGGDEVVRGGRQLRRVCHVAVDLGIDLLR